MVVECGARATMLHECTNEIQNVLLVMFCLLLFGMAYCRDWNITLTASTPVSGKRCSAPFFSILQSKYLLHILYCYLKFFWFVSDTVGYICGSAYHDEHWVFGICFIVLIATGFSMRTCLAL